MMREKARKKETEIQEYSHTLIRPQPSDHFMC